MVQSFYGPLWPGIHGHMRQPYCAKVMWPFIILTTQTNVIFQGPAFKGNVQCISFRMFFSYSVHDVDIWKNSINTGTNHQLQLRSLNKSTLSKQALDSNTIYFTATKASNDFSTHIPYIWALSFTFQSESFCWLSLTDHGRAAAPREMWPDFHQTKMWNVTKWECNPQSDSAAPSGFFFIQKIGSNRALCHPHVLPDCSSYALFTIHE